MMRALKSRRPSLSTAAIASVQLLCALSCYADEPTAFGAPEPTPVGQWGVGDAHSFLVPAYEIPAFQFLLNRFDHYVVDAATYPSPITNFKTNLHRSWVIDNDKFSTNQFLHPYQGSIYQGLARSAGLDFWQASAYTFTGSLVWEEAGENTAPSINDQIATGIGGNFLGEPLFRIASLLLEGGAAGPGFWRELGATAISPALGFNRLAYGDRFKAVFRSYSPAVFTRVDVGTNLSTNFNSNINANADPSAPPTAQNLQRGYGVASFTMGYGLPGKPGYDYDRPFDYFNFDVALDTANGIESIFSRGLLYGAGYAAGANYRGVWGAYGLYEYVAPNIFRVSSTAGAFGTTAQWWLSRDIALQGTALAALGYAGGGVIRGAGVTAPGPNGEGLRNYHYGLAPEAVLALRVLFGDRVALDATGRGYYISRIAASESTGSETITLADVALTFRVYKLNGLTVRYTRSGRDGRYVGLPNSHQTVTTINVGYTLLGNARFGAVEWRPDMAHRDAESDE
jgi:hypothetical protein